MFGGQALEVCNVKHPDWAIDDSNGKLNVNQFIASFTLCFADVYSDYKLRGHQEECS